MKKWNPYWLALLMGLMISVFCLAVADGMIGIEGTVTNDTGREYTVEVGNKTGLILFWASLILITGVFSFWLNWRHTLATVPVYLVAYYVLGAIFGSKMNHHFLPHDAGGFLRIGMVPDVVGAVGKLFLAQSLVFLVCAGIRRILLTKRR